MSKKKPTKKKIEEVAARIRLEPRTYFVPELGEVSGTDALDVEKVVIAQRKREQGGQQ